jgi:hypothetical protein
LATRRKAEIIIIIVAACLTEVQHAAEGLFD